MDSGLVTVMEVPTLQGTIPPRVFVLIPVSIHLAVSPLTGAMPVMQVGGMLDAH